MKLLLKNLSLVVLVTLVSCASRESAWNKKSSSVSLSASEQKALVKEAKALWAKRLQTESLTEALSKFELLHGADAVNLEYLIYLTRGYYFLADAHLDNPDLKRVNYEKATSYGELAMATNSKFRDEVSSGKPVEEAIKVLTKDEFMDGAMVLRLPNITNIVYGRDVG